MSWRSPRANEENRSVCQSSIGGGTSPASPRRNDRGARSTTGRPAARRPFHCGVGSRVMFYHVKELQYQAKPERPDPIYARRLQELLGGQFGETTVMMAYLFQGWNCRGPAKYRDMLLDIGTEEIAHVEMLSVMIARLLEGAPVPEQEDRSEEHTSELQSRRDLVCRLLLEKKKKIQKKTER